MGREIDERGVRAVAHRRRKRRRRGSLGPLLRVLSVLLTAVAVVAALTLFFKVDQVVVSGNDRYSTQEIVEVSGVEQGDNLILMDKYRIAEKLYTQLPYITEVRINRKLPDVLMVEVVETQAVAAIKGGSSTWLLDSLSCLAKNSSRSFWAAPRASARYIS